MSNRAWVTLATNDSYGLGALVLAHSLRRAGSTYPSVVMITPTVTDAMKERLSAVFAEVIVVDVLDSRDAAHLALLQRPELGITFTKLHCWSLTHYEKCVFLDADTLIVQNCDELFEREELSAAPDVGWPDCFNSGVFVFKPSKETFDALVKFAQEHGSFDGGDQGLLNSFFSTWAHGDITKHLPFLYNVTSAAFYSYLPALQHFGQNLKIIHFIGNAKPWLQSFNWDTRTVEGSGHLQSTLQLWWDIFVSSVHPQLDTAMVEVDPPPALPPPDLLHHYEPPLDPNSQFPWHHPEAHRNFEEEEQSTMDFTLFHDPWENYRGNIPPTGNEYQKDKKITGGRVEISHDLRNHVREYSLLINDTHNLDTDEFEPHRIDQNIYYENTSQYHINNNHHHCNNHEQHINEEKAFSEYLPISSNLTNDLESQIINIITNNMPSNSNTSRNKTDDRIDYIPNGFSNGHTRDGNDFEEDVIPRHPYDGYYLKHIPTVDAQGRKVCSHEIPPTPPPSPPLDYIFDAENGTELHSGVAGNLARVIPGPSAIQHDALAELTRRQGWETGNIDYMGADSFDKIWVKISQTLAQPRTSPPKEISPPTQNDAKVQTLPAETVDVNQPQQRTEVIATPTVQPTVPATETTVVVEKIPVTAEVPIAPEVVASPVALEIPTADIEITPVVVELPVVPPVAVEVAPVPEILPEVDAPSITIPEVVPVVTVATPAAVEAVPVTAKVTDEPNTVVPEAVTLPASESKDQPSVVTKVEATPTVPTPEPKICESKTKSDQVVSTPESKPAKTSAEGETKLSTAVPVPVPEKPSAESDIVAPVKTLDLSTASSDSPPLAHTPAKEDPQPPAAAKSVGDGKGRKPAEKLQLCPPAHADPLPTPDSELEDAATLAQSIIAGELATPTVTSPTPPAPLTPASPPTDKRLAADVAVLDTPPAGPVSLAQIGVKGKPTTAEQIASSVEVKSEQPTPPPTPTEPVAPKEAAPKKKLVKKVVKKEAAAPSGESGPVPPPRKKEKKPKD